MLSLCGCDSGAIILLKKTDEGHNIIIRHKRFLVWSCSCMVVAGGLYELRCEDRSCKYVQQKKIFEQGDELKLCYLYDLLRNAHAINIDFFSKL